MPIRARAEIGANAELNSDNRSGTYMNGCPADKEVEKKVKGAEKEEDEDNNDDDLGDELDPEIGDISLDSEKDDGSELGDEFYTAVAF
jgi:hypothetical protein